MFGTENSKLNAKLSAETQNDYRVCKIDHIKTKEARQYTGPLSYSGKSELQILFVRLRLAFFCSRNNPDFDFCFDFLMDLQLDGIHTQFFEWAFQSNAIGVDIKATLFQ